MDGLRFASGAMLGAVKSAGALVLAALVTSAPVMAQNWIKVPPPIVPRTADGKPDLQAPVPRTPDGKPDLTGPWSSKDNSFLRDIARGMPPEAVPFQPWAKELFDRRKDGSLSREDPDASCLPQGVPKVDAVAYPWKMLQTPGSIVVVYEAFNLWRQIFMDGREPSPDANPTWHGYSTGRWDGDTLVVETRGFNGKAWLDQLGRPTTDAARAERSAEGFRPHGNPDHDRRSLAYTRPWGLTEEVGLAERIDGVICNETTETWNTCPDTTRSRR
jgi:hypothetical protein